jgi:hypothetical protein
MEDRPAFQTNDYRGHSVRATYQGGNQGEATIEVLRGNDAVWVANVPAYKIWNYAAHDTDLIDSILEEER